MYTKALAHFKNADHILYNVAKKIPPVEIKTSSHLFVSLCREIVGQQLSGRVARVIFDRFVNLFPNQIITPEHTVTLAEEEIRNIGASWSKAKFIKDLAQKVSQKEIDLESLREESNETVVERLTRVKGIGPWTAEMFLMFALGREDVFSPGDLGLRNAIMKLYNLNKRPTPQELEKISFKWAPYRTYASLILWESIDVFKNQAV